MPARGPFSLEAQLKELNVSQAKGVDGVSVRAQSRAAANRGILLPRARLLMACAKSAVESLERRTLLSAFYSYDVVASSGAGGFTGFGNGPSINDAGTVAYVGQHSNGDALFVKPEGGVSKELSPGFDHDPSRTFMQTVQINNSGKVVAQARVAGSTLKSFIQVWNSSGTDSFTTAATADSGGSGQFDAVFPFPSINNSGATAFGALKNGSRLLATPSHSIGESGIVMPMVADNGNIIVRAGGLSNSPITLFNSSLGVVTTVANSSMGFNTLGAAPGISDDGKVVVFSGDRGKGPGIFARFFDGSTLGPIVTIAGENTGSGGPNPELGFSDTGAKIFFSSFSMDSRVGVVHKDLGVSGPVGDNVEVSFIGTPSANSSTNTRTGTPFLFTNKLGLWSERVEMEALLSGSKIFAPHPDGALPAVQIGDKIGGQTVTGISVNDPISLPTTGDNGASRTVRPGDHRIAFYATTSSGSMIVRASHLDSDEDGLLDHWEKAGGGIDVNGDGTIDLNLNAMGANPLKRDLFMEVDWTTPRMLNGTQLWSNEMPTGVAHQLVNMFQNAPALADGVPAGITLHIDGGSGKDKGGNPFSINMGAGSLQGGNLITMSNGVTHPDVIYFGKNGAVSAPGVNARSLGDVKKQYFGNDSKNARELAFHYSVLCDFWGTSDNASGTAITGSVQSADSQSIKATTALPNMTNMEIMITSGKGAGQLAGVTGTATDGITGHTIFNVNKPWTVIPDSTSKFAFFTTSTGNSEVNFYGGPDNNGIPGNDTLITMGGIGASNGVLSNTFYTWRTMAHELGHTLGLRHGGTDQVTKKGTAYKSLMSYSYQLADSIPPTSQVNSYADASAGTYNDWANLKLDFQDSLTHMNNTFGFGPTGTNGDNAEIDIATAAQINGRPLDIVGPAVNITSPAANAVFAHNSTMTVKLTASDQAGVASVVIAFDINGDGKTTGAGESVTATLGSGGVYTANFAKLTGSLATRIISVIATDKLGNVSVTTRSVKVSP